MAARRALQHIPLRKAAACRQCDERCDQANAIAWAHNHARNHGHRVELTMVQLVQPDARPPGGRADG